MRSKFPALLAALALLPAAPAKKFLADDPLPAEPAPRDASQAIRRKISDYYDFFENLFADPGERHRPAHGKTPAKVIPARAVNTLGEPMKSAWWEPRHYYRRLSIEELVRGPGNSNAPSKEGKWKVVRAKNEGVTPGFEILDSRGRRYVLKFDPLKWPELATAPDVIVSKFFHAAGYHVPENYVVSFRESDLELGADVELIDSRGRPRKMTRRDVNELLLRVPRGAGGAYRGGASFYLSGKPLGPSRYYGVRRDDPTDTVPHEHRRDLRGLAVFCAWLQHDDSRAINSLDMLVREGGASYIRHHLIDFGSTLGSASYGPNAPRSGHEYLFEWTPAAKQFLTFGLWIPHWAKAKYPRSPAIGRFESEKFIADRWKAEYPNPAFENMLPDDAFWAAKQVMAFTDEEIYAIVRTGQYSRPEDERYIAQRLIERRDNIGRAWFSKLLPLDRFRVEGSQLVYDDLGALHKFTPPGTHSLSWSVFDNERESSTPLGATGPRIPNPPGANFLMASIRGTDAKKTVSVYLRRGGGTWTVVGVERGW